jgi:hypothetical protein
MELVARHEVQVLELIDQGHAVLNRFRDLEEEASDAAWQAVVELQELVDQLRQLRPPRPFLARER